MINFLILVYCQISLIYGWIVFDLQRHERISRYSDQKQIEKVYQGCKKIDCEYQNDIYYTIRTSIDQKQFDLLIDLNSTVLWIKQDTCQSYCTKNSNCLDRCGYKQFTNKVKLIKPLSKQMTIGGQKQNLTGKIYQKQIQFLGEKFFSQDLKIFGVTLMNNFQKDFEADGVIGFDFPTQKQLKPFQNQIKNLTYGVYSIYLKQIENKTQLFLSGYEEGLSKLDSEIEWIQVKQQEKMLSMISIQRINVINVLDAEVNQDIKVLKPAILSLQSSFLNLPKNVMSQIVNALKKFQIDCEITSPPLKAIKCNIQNVNIFLKQLSIDIQISDNIKLNLDSSTLIKECSIKQENYECILNIRQNEQIILGEIFFRNYYTIFDINNKKIGFWKIDTNLVQNKYNIWKMEHNYYLKIGFYILISLSFIILFTILIKGRKWTLQNFNIKKYYTVESFQENSEINLNDQSVDQIDMQEIWEFRVDQNIQNIYESKS